MRRLLPEAPDEAALNGDYELSGLWDFEPSMIGAPEYEFASVGVFFSCGDPEELACR